MIKNLLKIFFYKSFSEKIEEKNPINVLIYTKITSFPIRKTVDPINGLSTIFFDPFPISTPQTEILFSMKKSFASFNVEKAEKSINLSVP